MDTARVSEHELWGGVRLPKGSLKKKQELILTTHSLFHDREPSLDGKKKTLLNAA